jgi:hypothetical protein
MKTDLTNATQHGHAADAASRPQDRGFFEDQNRLDTSADLSVAAPLMPKPLNEALRAGDSPPPLLVIPTCHLSVLG